MDDEVKENKESRDLHVFTFWWIGWQQGGWFTMSIIHWIDEYLGYFCDKYFWIWERTWFSGDEQYF